MKKFDNVQDSGERQSFSTGSVRDTQEGKGLPHLIPPQVMRRIAQHYENGAKKYGPRNWEKGQPLSRYYDSAQRHLWSILEGKSDEDHFSAAIWNIMSMMHHIDAIEKGELPKELDDLGLTDMTVHNAKKLATDIIKEYNSRAYVNNSLEDYEGK